MTAMVSGTLLLAAVAAPLCPALYLPFGTVCHQIPERCFQWHGLPFAICARCLGLYAGVLAGAVRPIRIDPGWIVLAVAANCVDFVFDLAAKEVRWLLAFGLAWLVSAWLLRLASPREAAAH